MKWIWKCSMSWVDVYIYVSTCGFLLSVKQVFSDLDFLGWYTTGDATTETDIKVHKQVASDMAWY